MEKEMFYPTQENDPRANDEKPNTTWQEYKCDEGILTVHLTDDPMSPIYFQGKPEDYKGGAVKCETPIVE